MSSILRHNFPKTVIHVETHYPVLFDTFVFDKHSVQETVILLHVCVYIMSFCSYQNVDIWYIGFLFFNMCSFLSSQSKHLYYRVGAGN